MTQQQLDARYSSILDIQQRRTIFLNDAVAFYNKTNRATDTPQTSYCVYRATDKSPGCVIGRCLPEAVACSLVGAISDIMQDPSAPIPLWMREMGAGFLFAMQMLHDNKTNWTELGLSETGLQFTQNVKHVFKL